MKLVKRFLLDSRSQWWRLGFLTIALILAASFEIIAPRLLGDIVDAIVQGLEQHREINAILDGTIDTVLLLIIFTAATPYSHTLVNLSSPAVHNAWY